MLLIYIGNKQYKKKEYRFGVGTVINQGLRSQRFYEFDLTTLIFYSQEITDNKTSHTKKTGFYYFFEFRFLFLRKLGNIN